MQRGAHHGRPAVRARVLSHTCAYISPNDALSWDGDGRQRRRVTKCSQSSLLTTGIIVVQVSLTGGLRGYPSPTATLGISRHSLASGRIRPCQQAPSLNEARPGLGMPNHASSGALLVSMQQEEIFGNPNMQLGGLLAPYPSDDDGVQIVEEVLSHRVEDGRVLLECWTSGGEWATVVLTPVDPYVVRMTLYPSGIERTPRATPCLVADPPFPLDAPTPPFPGTGDEAAPDRSSIEPYVLEEGDLIKIWCGEILVEITRKPWELAVKNRHGFQIVREHRADTNLRGWRRASWLGYRRAPDGSVAATFDALSLAPDEHIYGLGEKFMPPDRRGQRIESWNFNTWGATNERAYKNVPFFVSTRGYGVFLNTTFKATWDVGSGATSALSTQIETTDDRLDLFLITGLKISDVLARYTGLTGRPPVPPRWSFGFWQSKVNYSSWHEVWAIVNKAREEKVPTDVIHLDPPWLREGMFADLVWDLTASRTRPPTWRS